MQQHYNEIAKQAKTIANNYAKLDKCKSNFDRASALLEIEQQKHKLHCLCVECGVADYSEERYGEKKRWLDSFHERVVLFDKPNI